MAPGFLAVPGLVLVAELVDAVDLAVGGARGEEGQQVRHSDRELLLLPVGRAPGEDRERRGLRRVVERLRGSHLHRLHLGHDLALDVAADRDAETREQGDGGADPDGLQVERCVALVADRTTLLEVQVRRDAEHEGASGHVRRHHHVRERHQLDLVEHHRPEVGELGAAGLGVVLVADRVLHPGVRGEDEVGGEQGADVHRPDRRRVDVPRQLPPPEDPQSQERRLEEEREQPLDRQRCSEDVADEA
ncbi:hypothetical protein ACVW00_002544 [Marmoricola sp. URHA0025 HA25]